MTLLAFVFGGFWRFIGCALLVCIVGNGVVALVQVTLSGVADIVAAFRGTTDVDSLPHNRVEIEHTLGRPDPDQVS